MAFINYEAQCVNNINLEACKKYNVMYLSVLSQCLVSNIFLIQVHTFLCSI